MEQKRFDKLTDDLEAFSYAFRGQTLTEDQFTEVEELMNIINLCYRPCYMESNQPVVDEAPIGGFVENEDGYFHFFPGSETAEELLDMIRERAKQDFPDITNYDNAMKAMKAVK